jgi:hypothetical protein
MIDLGASLADLSTIANLKKDTTKYTRYLRDNKGALKLYRVSVILLFKRRDRSIGADIYN